MENKKQSAVMWLKEVYKTQGRILETQFEQALEMEMEQQIKFADNYADDVMGGCLLKAEQYYNITYAK